jgi:hypothetical protein
MVDDYGHNIFESIKITLVRTRPLARGPGAPLLTLPLLLGAGLRRLSQDGYASQSHSPSRWLDPQPGTNTSATC